MVRREHCLPCHCKEPSLFLLVFLTSTFGLLLKVTTSVYVHNRPTSGPVPALSRVVNSLSSEHDDEWFKVLGFDNSNPAMTMVNVGGKDRFLQLRLPSLDIVNTVRMLPEDSANRRCIDERAGSLCSNWIRTLIHFQNGSYLLCGTNARQPRCQVRHSNFVFSGTEFSGVGLAPFEPTTNFSTLYAKDSNKMYSLILEDEVDAPIFSPTIVSYDVATLNPLNPFPSKSYVASRRHMLWPRFSTRAFDVGDKVIMFWTEKDDRGECPRRLTPYVGQFCKDDEKTASGNLGFMSFFKARLYCARHTDRDMFGQRQSTQIMSHLMFDEIAGVSERFGQDNDLFYVAFNRDYRDSQGIAVCLFSVRNISQVFRTSRFRAFKPQSAEQDAYVTGLPLLSPKYPNIRPTECGRSYSEEELYTLRNNKTAYFSMLDRIQMGGRGAVFLDTVIPDRLTAIAVDWDVKAANSKSYDVLFLGTDTGRFLRVVTPHLATASDLLAGQGWLVEEVTVFENENITDILVISSERQVLLVSSSSIRTVSFSNCSVYRSCSSCVEARDPYCSWDVTSYSCLTSLHGMQDLDEGNDGECPPETTTTTTTTTTSTMTTTTSTSSVTTTTSDQEIVGASIEFIGGSPNQARIAECPSPSPQLCESVLSDNSTSQSAIVGSVVGVLAFLAGGVLGALGCWFILRPNGVLAGSKVVKSLRCGSTDGSGSSDVGGDAELITNAFRSNGSSSNGSGAGVALGGGGGGGSSCSSGTHHLHHPGIGGVLGSSTTTTFSSALTPATNNSLLRAMPQPQQHYQNTLPKPPAPRLPPQISTGTLPGHGNAAAKKIYV